MNRLSILLSRLAVWLTSERIVAIGMAFYGVHIWLCHSFRGNSAFAVYNVPEWVFALPLLAGAALEAWGIRRASDRCLLAGALCGFSVFLSALVSCLIAAPTTTGIGAYGILSLLFFALALRRATGREYTFSP